MKFDHPLTREQQHLVEQNISLIHWTIWKYIDVKEEICGLAYDDLHQEGALALCYAAAQFAAVSLRTTNLAFSVVFAI